MIYYLVVNEWLYPKEERGRELVNECNSLEEATRCSRVESELNERDFISNVGDIYKEACGPSYDKGDCTGYILRNKEGDCYFWSRIVKVESLK